MNTYNESKLAELVSYYSEQEARDFGYEYHLRTQDTALVIALAAAMDRITALEAKVEELSRIPYRSP